MGSEMCIRDSVIIKELDNHAVFEFTITNLGERDSFELYSLVGVEITPSEAFTINKGERKTLRVEIEALKSVKKNNGFYNFVYKIKGSDGIQEDTLQIKLVNLKDAFEVSADSITLDSEKTTVRIKNKEEFDFRKKRRDPFITGILLGSRIMLIGDEEDLVS